MNRNIRILYAFSLCLGLSAAAFAPVQVAGATTIDLGGIRLRLPQVDLRRTNRTQGTRTDSTYAQPRWYVAVQDGRRFATNNQGLWIGYDERGEMVMQIELTNPATAAVNSPVAVQFDVNGRYFDTIQGVLATDRLAIVHSADAERVLGRLMSGTRVLINVAGNRIETHLKGSSDAIDATRREAALQRRAVVEGKVTPQTGLAQPEVINFFLPGVGQKGTLEVRFDIVEAKGLVLYLNFSAITGHGDPAYSMPFSVNEAKRTVALLGKAVEWTEVARNNRVGLFSKRIGFVDDVNGGPVPLPVDEEDGTKPVEPQKSADAGLGTIGSGSLSIPEKSKAPIAAPQDFKAVNFNSYEDGTTSVQIEQSVRGFSRRFNLTLEEAQELSTSLESTIEYATFRLENRETNPEVKDELFR